MPHLGDLLPGQFRGRGLSGEELDAAQQQAGAQFPPDLCDLLTETLPVGSGFPDWRNRAGPEMQEWRERLVRQVHFDVVNRGFWLPEWESQPDDPDDSRAIVARHLAAAPAMIPIYQHRAIPNEPLEAGNPVFSIWQTDIIIYGRDLPDYLLAEFHGNPQQPVGDQPSEAEKPRSIAFWTRMLDPG